MEYLITSSEDSEGLNKNMATFKIWYDDQPDDIVNKINSALQEFGLTIQELDGGDGFNEYEIVKK